MKDMKKNLRNACLCSKAFCYKRKKGAALLAIMLVGFIVLSVLSFAAFNYATQATRVENFQTEHYQKERLQYIARSAAIALSGALGTHYAADTDRLPMVIGRSGSLEIVNDEQDGPIILSYEITGEAESTFLKILTKATNTKNDKALKMQCYYNKYATDPANRLYGWQSSWVDK